MMGSGGCSARALCALGVIGATPTDVEKELDARIDVVHENFNQQRRLKKRKVEHDRDRVGIEGDQWHVSVLKRTLMDMYDNHYTFKKHRVYNDGSCPILVSNPNGNYFVDGVLNRSYTPVITRRGRRVAGKRRYQHGADNNDKEEAWRHSIALVGGIIHCEGVGRVRISNLWLDKTGKPDHTRGYLKRIFKVYEVTVDATPWEVRMGRVDEEDEHLTSLQ